ncbi:MAG TPA: MmcQ/YjbR family DNA-binding protein [Solirubrobacteraceae bacterium]|nr:MmcQ/YjbR family DNA-binding protein [Solirubrobacteraceae bacterium]
MSVEQARALALALPEATEQDHHGRPSFRVRGKIFATLWDPEHMNVMLDEAGVLTAAQAHPGWCAPFHWGKRIRAVHVSLAGAETGPLAELLRDAWEGKS